MVFCLDDIEARLIVGERVGVYRCLGHKTVGHWEANDAGDERGAAKEEEVPMETGGLFERELACLGCEAADVLMRCYLCAGLAKGTMRLTWS